MQSHLKAPVQGQQRYDQLAALGDQVGPGLDVLLRNPARPGRGDRPQSHRLPNLPPRPRQREGLIKTSSVFGRLSLQAVISNPAST